MTLVKTLAQIAWSETYNSCSAGNQDFGSNLIKNLYSTIQTGECKLVNNTKYLTYDPKDGEVFDFVIVGAGAAGSVVANRLSENSNWKILVLEAGGEPSISTEIPGLWISLLRTSEDWKYFSETGDTNCLGMNDGRCAIPRGKVLGGSTAINAMNYLRGNPKDYNAWAAAGNIGWDFESVLPYFLKSENIIAQEILNSPDFHKYHSNSGFLKVDSFYKLLRPKDISVLNDYFSKSFEELGLSTYSDVNSGNNNPGLYLLQGTTDNGTRCSSAKAFLKSVEYRKNLHISIKSLVTKLLIKDKTAYGVEFINRNGSRIRVKANFEVVVSAGTYNSPQLLMLSGIGPKKHLQDLGIDVLQNSEVGQNLQEHLLFRGLLLSVNYTHPKTSSVSNLYHYLSSNVGKLTGLFTYCGFINSRDELDYPDVQIYFNGYNTDVNEYYKLLFYTSNINKTFQQSFLQEIKNPTTINVGVVLLRPESKGQVLLRSTNPLDPPKIYLNLFTKSADINRTISAIRFIEKLCKTKTLKKIGCSLKRLNVLHRSFEFNSDNYWEYVLKSLSDTIYHPIGTCKMGLESDSSAVVDSQLNVIGIRKLRVVDASVMPTTVSSNIMAATYMIGEKASDMIKNLWCPNGLKCC